MNTYSGLIMLVEDEPQVLGYLTQALTVRGVPVITFDNGDKALEYFLKAQAEGSQPKTIVVDDLLVGSTVTGLGIVRKVRELDDDCVIILISGADPEEKIKLAAGLLIDKFMQKPIIGQNLIEQILQAKARREGSPIADAVKSLTAKQAGESYLKAIVCFVLLGLTAWCVSNRIADARWQGQVEGTLKSDQQHTQQLLKIMKDDVDMSWAYVFLLRDQMKESGLKPLPIPKRPNYSEELEK